MAVGGPDDVGAAVADALGHLLRRLSERAEVLERAARLVADRAETFARTICLEAGKPMKQARGEAARCVDTLTFSAVEARSLAGEVVPMESSAAGAGKLGIILREPGVVGAISPFNFPLNLVAHKLAPAIAAGCPVVLKPASSTPLSALLLAHTLTEAGLPDGFLSVVIGGGGSVGNAIVDHLDVPMISFTGSPPWAGASASASRASTSRWSWATRRRSSSSPTPTSRWPPRSSPPRATPTPASRASRCSASTSTRRHFDRFRDLFVGAVEGLVVGDPMDDATDVGPVIDEESRERILEWIGEARQAGAEVLAGGGLNEEGLIAPTVIEGIDPEMKVSCEVFGPVVGLASYASIDEAIDLANSSPFGLQGIFTARTDAAMAWAGRLHFGGVVINETPTFRADQMPYGGVKDSGNTREGPRFAVRSMSEQKLVLLNIPRG